MANHDPQPSGPRPEGVASLNVGATPGVAEEVRGAELIAATCLATDLAMGFPFEHGLRATSMTVRLAERCDVDLLTASQAYHASLLMYVGCMTDAHATMQIFAGSMEEHMTPAQFGSRGEILRGVVRAIPHAGASPPRRIVEIARRFPRAAMRVRPQFEAMCEVAELLADRIGVPGDVPKLFPYLTERWDGKGVLGRAQGDAIPLAIRLMHVARDAAFQRMIGGEAHAVETIRRRAGHAFDPDVARTFVLHASEMFQAADDPSSAWNAVLAAEPRPHLSLSGDAIDRALAAIGTFAELASPYLAGHSEGVADTRRRRRARVRVGRRRCPPRSARRPPARRRTRRGASAGLGDARTARCRRVGTGPPARLSRRPRGGPLAVPRVARVDRLRTPRTPRRKRVSPGASGRWPPAARSPPRGGGCIPALTESRAHRPAYRADEAAEILGDEAKAGRLDAEMVAAVLQGAGQPAPRIERPAGLTERELEVIGLLAHGLQTKQVARALGISIKTADRHIQNAYRKVGVSTRAGAAMFAMEHGIVPWGGLPIADPPRGT